MNPHWLELPLSRTNFDSPKGVRAIEVRLYFAKDYCDVHTTLAKVDVIEMLKFVIDNIYVAFRRWIFSANS